jgi:predicted secreted protein
VGARGGPRALVTVVVAAVARDRDKRLPTAQVLADALAPLVEPGAAAEWAQRLAQDNLPDDEPTEPSRLGPRPPVPTDPAVPALDMEWEAPRAAPALQAMPRVSARANRLRRRAAAADDVPAAPVAPKAAKRPRHGPGAGRRAADAEAEAEDPSSDRAPGTPRSRRAIVAAVPVLAAVAMLFIYRLSEAPRVEVTELPEPLAGAAPAAEGPPPASPVQAQAEARSERRSPQSREPGPRRGGRGTLVLTASSPAFVRSGELDLGLTPVTVQLPAGRHALELQSADGTRGAKVEVEVPRGGTVETKVTLQPR